MLQGNIAQDQKWNPAMRDAITGRYIDMTRQALAQGATFIIWPESATPLPFEQDSSAARRSAGWRRESQATLLIGSDQVEPIKAAPAVGAAGSRALQRRVPGQAGRQRRGRLPQDAPRAVRRVRAAQPAAVLRRPARRGGVGLPVHAGTRSRAAAGGGHMVSTAICYEVIYPDLMRRFVRDGSELLTTITNDAWYGRSSAAYQHWDQASLRAIEEGRYLARAANTGISGFVDPYGRVLQKTGALRAAVVVRGHAVPDGSDDLQPHRRPGGVAVAGADRCAGAPGSRRDGLAMQI